MNVMPPQWIKWIDENIRLGLAPGAMIATLVQNRFDSAFSAQVVMERVAAVNRERQSKDGAAGKADAQAGSATQSMAGGRQDNAVQLADRRVGIAVRMRRPDIVVYEDVLSPQECRELIELARPKMKRATLVDMATGEARLDPTRSSDAASFRRNENPFVAMLDRRLAELMRLPVECGEGLQVLNYQVGGEYKPHYDYFPPHLTGSDMHIKHGQRVATCILYLNDVEAGGETVFPKIDFSVTPRQGSALYFSYFRDGQVDPLTFHAGAPVVKGEKWIATRWMREREFTFG